MERRFGICPSLQSRDGEEESAPQPVLGVFWGVGGTV